MIILAWMKAARRYGPRLILYAVSLAILTSFTFSNAKPEGLKISLHHFIGSQSLLLDSATYKNALGQNFTISKFRYYLSNFELTNKQGKVTRLNQYYLVDEEIAESKQINLPAPGGDEYTSLSFLVGVDSLHNCSGAQSGALDPVNGMFWTWSTGYIFLKLEGYAATSKSPGHIFEYHIGGYATPNNCIRRVTLALNPASLKSNNGIDIKVDALKILAGKTTVDFAKLSSVTDFHNAAGIADNYTGMFSIMP